MNKLCFILEIPKSLWFCLKSLPIRDALKLPVWVSHRTKFKSLKGKVVIKEKSLRPAMVRFRYAGSGTASFKPIVIENNGTMVLNRGVFFEGVSDLYSKQRCFAYNWAGYSFYGRMPCGRTR